MGQSQQVSDGSSTAAGPGVPLSAETITDAAIVFIEDRGLERLTMRALATELGCGTMSLYSHIRSRDDLFSAIVRELVRRSEIPDLAAREYESWQDLAMALHHAYRALAERFPRSFELLALAPYEAAPVAGYLENMVESLRRGGLSRDQAYEVFGALDAYSTGFLTVWARKESSGEAADADASSRLQQSRSLEMFDRGLRVFITGFTHEFG